MPTQTELEEMVVRLTADAADYLRVIAGATTSTKDAADKIEGEGKRVENVFSQMKKAALDFAISFASIATLKEAFGNFSEAEAIGIRLSATLEANERDVEGLTQRYTEYAQQLEKTTTLEDDFVLSLLATAEGYNLTGAAAEKAIADAAALAAAKGGTAETYIRFTAAMAKGDIELAQAMARLIPELRGIKDQTEFVARANRLIAAGQSALSRELETSSGQLKALSRDWGNLLEGLGAFVAQGAGPVVRHLRDMVALFRETPPAVQATTTGVIALVAASKGLQVLGLSSPFAWTVTAIAGLTGLAVALQQNTQAAQDYNNELAKIKENSQFIIQTLGNAAQKATAKVAGALVGEERTRVMEEEWSKLNAQVEIHRESLHRAQGQYDEILNRSKTSGGQFLRKMLSDSLGLASTAVEEQRKQFGAATTSLTQFTTNMAENGTITQKTQDNVKELTRKLQDQIAVFGLSEQWAAIYKLEIESGGKANLDNARGIAQMVDWLNQDKKAKEEAAKATEQLTQKTMDFGNELDVENEKLQRELEGIKLTTAEAKLLAMIKGGQLDEATEFHLRGLVEENKALEEQKRIMEDGQRLTKEIMGHDPVAKFQERIAELQDAFAEGAIVEEIFAMGVAQANKEMDEAAKKTDQAAQALEKYDAALSGSAEARQRIQAFLDKNAVKRRDAGLPPALGQEVEAPAVPKLPDIANLPDIRKPIDQLDMGDVPMPGHDLADKQDDQLDALDVLHEDLRELLKAQLAAQKWEVSLEGVPLNF